MKNKLQKLRKLADKLWQTRCLEGNVKCVGCGKMATVGHHYIPKSICSVLRYDLYNGICLCMSCHIAIHRRNDPEINNKILETMGNEWLKFIRERRKIKVQADRIFYEKAINFLSKGREE